MNVATTMTEPTKDLADIFSADVGGGWRMDYFEAYNWGSFHERVGHLTLDRQNSLLTGTNAAGKSTMADGVITLLVPTTKRNYNAASGGNKQDRSEIDYLRGYMGAVYDPTTDRDEPIIYRPDGGYYTVLLAVFRNRQTNKTVTLAQILWVKNNGESVKLHIVEQRALTIAGDLANFTSTVNIRSELKERGFDPIDKFKDYSEKFHRYLRLNSAQNPMGIFNQTVAVKDIRNLTQFIRDYMLDDGSASQLFEELKTRVREMRTTYNLIKMQKEQLLMLESASSHVSTVKSARENWDLYNKQRAALDSYFAQVELKLRLAQSEQNTAELARLAKLKAGFDEELKVLQTKLDYLIAKQDSSPQGANLTQLTEKLKTLTGTMELKQQNFTRFQTDLGRLHPNKRVDSAETFVTFIAGLPAEIKGFEDAAQACSKDEQDKLHTVANVKREFDGNEKQIASLIRQPTSIDEEFLARRDHIADTLGIPRSKMPFVGELTQINPAYEKWTGAIEALLHSFALTILVHRDNRDEVDTFVSRNNMRGRIEYDIVDAQVSPPSKRRGNNTVAGRLDIKPDAGNFAAYVLKELHQRFAHVCCDNTDQQWHLADQALTITGLIKNRSGRRIKDDRRDIQNRQNWVLGWNNQAKLDLHLARRKQLGSAQDKAKEAYDQALAKKRADEAKLGAAKHLLDAGFTFEQIDTKSIAVEIAGVQTKIDLIKKDPALDKLGKDIAADQKQFDAKKQLLKEVDRQHTILENDEVKNMEQIAALEKVCNQQTPEQQNQCILIRKRLELPVTRLAELEPRRKSLYGEYSLNMDEAKDLERTQTSAALAKMSAIVQHEGWQHLHDDIGSMAPIDLTDEVIERFQKVETRIRKDDIPKNEEKFRRLLQHNVIDDFNTFDKALREMEQAIRTRVEKINFHLAKVDFDRRTEKTTYIQLVPEKTKEQAVKDFRFKMDNALKNILNADESVEVREQCFHQINGLIEELDKDPKTRDHVIDVRNWFDFKALERYREGNIPKETYSGAGGKSGGEKYRLAATILATAIAYQYDIEIDRPEGDNFRFILVDEAMSRMGTEFCEYLFELFQRFHLQILIIHPGDAKLHLTEKYVSRFNVITKPGKYSQASNMSVHQFQEFKKLHPPE